MKRMIRTPLVRLVDDDDAFRESQREFLKAMGWQVEDYAGAADLLERDDLSRPGCLVLDIRMPGMTGVELQRRLFDAKCTLPVIFLTGHGDITTAVHTMKYGAADFLEKRGDPLALAGAVERACVRSMRPRRTTTGGPSSRLHRGSARCSCSPPRDSPTRTLPKGSALAPRR